MNSTSTSKSQDLVLEVKNLNIVHNISVFRSMTWRDVFVEALHHPFKFFGEESDRYQIIRDINFKVHRGERIGLLGINGVGKTSLCRAIAGTYSPSVGRIARYAPIRAIFDTQIGIQPELTGRENAELIAHFLFPYESKIGDLVDDSLEFSDLGNFVDVPYKFYSNGMRTRLHLSLISARPAGLLILDEVFDGADSFFKERVAKRILNVIHQSGAVIFVSHSFDQIQKVCNRVLVLHGTKIHFDGPPEEAIKVYNQLHASA